MIWTSQAWLSREDSSLHSHNNLPGNSIVAESADMFSTDCSWINLDLLNLIAFIFCPIVVMTQKLKHHRPILFLEFVVAWADCEDITEDCEDYSARYACCMDIDITLLFTIIYNVYINIYIYHKTYRNM